MICIINEATSNYILIKLNSSKHTIKKPSYYQSCARSFGENKIAVMNGENEENSLVYLYCFAMNY